MTISTTAEKAVITAGIVLFVCFLLSRLLLANSPFDTGQRGLALGAVSASIGLTLVWFVVALVIALFRRGKVLKGFWGVLVLDGIIVAAVVIGSFR